MRNLSGEKLRMENGGRGTVKGREWRGENYISLGFLLRHDRGLDCCRYRYGDSGLDSNISCERCDSRLIFVSISTRT